MYACVWTSERRTSAHSSVIRTECTDLPCLATSQVASCKQITPKIGPARILLELLFIFVHTWCGKSMVTCDNFLSDFHKSFFTLKSEYSNHK